MNIPLRQSNRICPACNKSYYRRGDRCNICGNIDPIPAGHLTDHQGNFSMEGREAKGRIWDSKTHKYVR